MKQKAYIWEDKPGVGFVLSIVCIVLVRMFVVCTTESRYYAIWQKTLTVGEERFLYYGTLLLGIVLIWAFDLGNRLFYIGFRGAFPALLCFALKNIFRKHWTEKLPFLILVCVIAFTLFRVVLTIAYDKRRGERSKRLLDRASLLYFKGLVGGLLVFCACIVLVTWIKPELMTVSSETLESVAEVPLTPEMKKRQMWMDNPEKMKKLNGMVFYSLSLEEKLEALRFVVDTELDYLGCDIEVELVAEDTERNSLHGFFDPVSGQICIQKRILERGFVETCIDTILHECYHIYQYQCIRYLNEQEEAPTDLLMFRTIEQWQAEMTNYKSGEGDYDAYRNQRLESDAFDYASEWLGQVIQCIPSVPGDTMVDRNKLPWVDVEIDYSWADRVQVGTIVETSPGELTAYDNAEDVRLNWESLMPEYEDTIKLICRTDSFRVYIKYFKDADGTEINEVLVRTKDDVLVRLDVDYLTLMKNSGTYLPTDTRFEEKDFDGDGEGELAILLTILDTNCSVDELMVIDRDGQKKWEAFHLTRGIYQDWMKNRVEIVKEEGQKQLLLDTEPVGNVLNMNIDHYYMSGAWIYTSVPKKAEHDFELINEYIIYAKKGVIGYFPGNAFLQKINYLGEGRWEMQELTYQEMEIKNPVAMDTD